MSGAISGDQPAAAVAMQTDEDVAVKSEEGGAGAAVKIEAAAEPMLPAAAAADHTPANPYHPSLPRVRGVALSASLDRLSRVLHAKARYRSSLARYERFLHEKSELSMLHGASPAYKQIVIPMQQALKQQLPYQLVHAFSERGEEVRQAEEAYERRGLQPPQGVVRRRLIPERLRGPRVPVRPLTAREIAEATGRPERAPREAHAGGHGPGGRWMHFQAEGGPIAPGSSVRTIFGATAIRRPIAGGYDAAAASNPLLNNLDRAEAHAGVHADYSHMSSGGKLPSGLTFAQARNLARRAGTLLPTMPLVYSALVSSLDTWFDQADLAARVRVKENTNFLTWAECYGYDLEKGEEDFEKLNAAIKKDLEKQWQDYVWRGIAPQARVDTWNKYLKPDRLRVDRAGDGRRLRMVALPGWVRLETDPPEDVVESSAREQEEAPAAAPAPCGPGRWPQKQAASAPQPQPITLNNPAVMQQMMAMWMLQQQQQAQQQQSAPSPAAASTPSAPRAAVPRGHAPPVPNAGQQRDVVVDSDDCIDCGESLTESALEVEVERLLDTTPIPAVAVPCPFLPVTVSKIGGKSILFLLLYANLGRFVSTPTLVRLAQHHFPASWAHFFATACQRFPHIANNPPLIARLWEHHLAKGASTHVDRHHWNARLQAEESLRIEAQRGVGDSFLRVVRAEGAVRPQGAAMALGDRLLATLRVAAAEPPPPAANQIAAAELNAAAPLQPAAIAQVQLPPATEAASFSSQALSTQPSSLHPPLPAAAHSFADDSDALFADSVFHADPADASLFAQEQDAHMGH